MFNFLLIRVIYWNFLDAILGHTPSLFKLFTPLSFRWISGIVSGSPIFSTALSHHVRIPYPFDNSPTSCLDPLFFSATLRHRVWIPFSFQRLYDIVSGSHIFYNDSSASCLDPLSFRWLSDNVSRSSTFFTVHRHRARISYLFGCSMTSCPYLLFFWQLFGIVPRSPIFSLALWHHVRIPYLFNDPPASCSNPIFFSTAL